MSKIIEELRNALGLLTKSTEENKKMLKDFIAQKEPLDSPEQKPLLPDKKEPGEGQEILTDSIETKK